MNYSIRHCAFVISALLIGVSAIDLNTPAQAEGTIDQSAAIDAGAGKIAEAGEANFRAERAQQTQNIAYAALTQCYTYNNANGCSQLTQIKSTLANRCEQNDRDSCTVYRNIVGFEGLKQTEQTTEDLSKIAGGAG